MDRERFIVKGNKGWTGHAPPNFVSRITAEGKPINGKALLR